MFAELPKVTPPIASMRSQVYDPQHQVITQSPLEHRALRSEAHRKKVKSETFSRVSSLPIMGMKLWWNWAVSVNRWPWEMSVEWELLLTLCKVLYSWVFKPINELTTDFCMSYVDCEHHMKWCVWRYSNSEYTYTWGSSSPFHLAYWFWDFQTLITCFPWKNSYIGSCVSTFTIFYNHLGFPSWRTWKRQDKDGRTILFILKRWLVNSLTLLVPFLNTLWIPKIQGSLSLRGVAQVISMWVKTPRWSWECFVKLSVWNTVKGTSGFR